MTWRETKFSWIQWVRSRLQNSDNNVLQQNTNKVKWPVTLYSLAFWAESLLHLRSYTSSLRPFSTHFNGKWIKMHHCSFYLRKVVLIYDMGKCELVGIKAAVWKNVLPICQTSPIFQTRWTFFFTWFNFTLTCRPRSNNATADALSSLAKSQHLTLIL